MSFDLPDAIELKKITEDKYSEIVYQNLWWLYKWIQNIDLYTYHQTSRHTYHLTTATLRSVREEKHFHDMSHI
jgi:hypothetical protein